MLLTHEFNHRLAIRMFHNLALNNKMTGIHKRCSRIIFNDKNSNF